MWITALSNLKKVLELGGSSLEQVVKYTVFLKDMDDFAEMNKTFVAVNSKPVQMDMRLHSVPAQSLPGSDLCSGWPSAGAQG